MTRTIEPNHFDQDARRIRAQASTVLTNWGLPARFARWRLAKDPDTGMIVLFGVLNSGYIATHTSIPFKNYFDPQLLRDLANQLEVQVVSCNADGLRYAFILDRGQLDNLPTHIDYPFIDHGKLTVRVVYRDSPASMPSPSVPIGRGDDHNEEHRDVRALLKAFDDIQLKNAASRVSDQDQPHTVIIDEDEFGRRVATHEADLRTSKHIRELFDEKAG